MGTIWVGFWAGAIGASNTMLLGGFISIAATALIGVLWRPIRDFRSDDDNITSDSSAEIHLAAHRGGN